MFFSGRSFSGSDFRLQHKLGVIILVHTTIVCKIRVVRNHHNFFHVIRHMILIGSRLAEATGNGDRKCKLTEYPHFVQIKYAVPIICMLSKSLGNSLKAMFCDSFL